MKLIKKGLWITVAQDEKIKKIAEETGETQSTIFRLAIEEYLKNR